VQMLGAWFDVAEHYAAAKMKSVSRSIGGCFGTPSSRA
jgi:hypothetical protein